MKDTRLEHDFLGEMEIDNSKLYGIQTERALINFPISNVPISNFPNFIKAFAHIKKAAAQANLEQKALEPVIGEAIIKACDELIEGKHLEQFPIDVIQGGAGTSSNMNANEVICNRALELYGKKKGEYQYIHPNNHVNKSQSTNDVYPTAIRITTYLQSLDLEKVLENLKTELEAKAEEFAHVIKMGRTQLQDAVPMSLGQEFKAWAITIGEDIERLRFSRKLLLEINMGATAIGTGILAKENYSVLVTKYLSKSTGLELISSSNFIEATQDCGCYIQYSSVIKRIACKLSKICNDLRLLSSGPRTGINEINLPPRQPGSSIMPGKVNPVIPEVVNQVAFEVIGNDVTITMAAEAGQLELNAMEPIIAYSLFCSNTHLTKAVVTLTDNCIKGITANEERCKDLMEHSIGIVTILMPVLGYEKCSFVAKQALSQNKSVRDVLLENKLLTTEEIDEIMQPVNMARNIR
ncbi:MAG: aspartate ammonia-lyase [Spirochaetales bacterium]|nr:aspartate ammonia-lyase [Spirochaetales bacterium]